MATLFARQGAIVFGCDISVDAANKAAETIRNDGKVKANPCRQQGQSGVDVMQESIVSHYGHFNAHNLNIVQVHR
jgi:NAD(P)-dependent dehydrogenase (short-subunit alcohol dehydrogenase family)